MKIRRRHMIASSLAAGAASIFNFNGINRLAAAGRPADKYAALDEALSKPVLRKELFPDPIIIESLELLVDRKSCIYRVRSKDGAEGVSVGHPIYADLGYAMVKGALAQHFVGKDARELDQMIFNATERNVKKQGIPLDIHVAGIEFAILDMLGIIANKPAGQVLGEVVNPRVSIYLGHLLSEFRRLEPEQSIALMQADVQKTEARAVKLRAGRGDGLATNIDNAPGRTEKLIKLARKTFGDDFTLMIDGNGSYDVKEAIRIGKILEEYKFNFYEEPLPWDWYEEQKQVEQAMKIPMAGGEEEFGMHAFRYLIGNEVFQIVQPDLFYFGGMVRSMRVARMAQAAGIHITPHISEGGLGFLYMLHMVAVCPAAYEYHEFKLFEAEDANGNIIPYEAKAGPFESHDGYITAPKGSGLGIIIDPDYIKTHKPYNR